MKTNLVELFEESTNKYPQKIAVIDRERRITFSDLRNKALALAQNLNESGIGTNKPIALFLDKSIESVYVNLAILYSGNFYMNLDIKTPAERISNILNLIKPHTIISTSRQIVSIADIIPKDIRVVLLDEEYWEEQINEKAIIDKLSTIIDTDPSCIINTSGSTGTPKGVVLNHKSFFDFIEWAIDTFKFDNNLIMGSLSLLVFDIYSFELCMLMAKASTLVVLPGNLAAFPAKILDLIDKNQVNFLFWVPTIMVNIANMDLLSSYRLNSLKTIWFAGEVFPTKQFN
jgi:non-ribosomal peptide synthetase component F